MAEIDTVNPEEEDDAAPGLGALAAYQSTLAARDREEGSAIDAAYAPLRKRYAEAAARLREQRLGPSSAEKLFELGSALSAPMRYKGIGAVVGNLAPVLQGQARTKREGESARANALLDLEGKQYELGSEAEMAKIKGRSGRAAALDKLMLTQAKGPRTGFNPVTGRLEYMSGPDAGMQVRGGAQPSPEGEIVRLGDTDFRKDQKGNLVAIPRTAAAELDLEAAKIGVRTAAEIAAAAEKDRNKSTIDAATAATTSLPKVLTQGQQALGYINDLRRDPGVPALVGLPNPFEGGLGPFGEVRGSKAAGTKARIEQLQGGAFLQAFEQLKGAGQITEIEGVKATNAIARLSTAQSEADFNRALSDYESVIRAGLTRAQRQAAQLQRRAGMGGAAPAPAPSGRPPLSSFMKGN